MPRRCRAVSRRRARRRRPASPTSSSGSPPLTAASGNLNPNVLFKLFSMYRDWQEQMAKKISGKQEEIETADAIKLL